MCLMFDVVDVFLMCCDVMCCDVFDVFDVF